MTTYTASQITGIGGREWRKADDTLRVYINADVWAPMVGLDVDHYNSGNISCATLDGQEISNGRARDILGCIDKVYWDSADGQIHILVYRNRYSDQVPGWIREAIARSVAALDKHDDTSTPAAAEQITAPEGTLR
jgi:hypothetical protein